MSPVATLIVTLVETVSVAVMVPVLREMEPVAEPGWMRRWSRALAAQVAAVAAFAAAGLVPIRLWAPVLAAAAALFPPMGLAAVGQRALHEMRPGLGRFAGGAAAASFVAAALLPPVGLAAGAVAGGLAVAVAKASGYARGCRRVVFAGVLLGPAAAVIVAAGATPAQVIGACAAALASAPLVVLAGGIHITSLRVQRLQDRVELLQRENELLASRAEVDPLTGCSNRHALRDWFERWDGTVPVTLLVVDVDGLKAINDRYGHAAGDHALQLVARILREATREGDLVVRWGGDEFVAVLQDMGEDTARLRYAQLVRLLTEAAEEFPYPVPLRASWGVASCTGKDGVAEALHEADRRMYAMKQKRGRSG